MFVLISTAALLAIYGYIGWRLIGPSPLVGLVRAGAWGLLLGMLALHVGGFSLTVSGATGTWLVPLQWVNYTLLGAVVLVFSLTVTRDVFWAALHGVDVVSSLLPNSSFGVLPGEPVTRRLLLNLTSLGIVALAGLGAAAGLVEARRVPRVETVEVPIAGLPADLEGFGIVQVSDLHVGPTIRRDFVQAVVDRANSLDADLCAVTGDLADGPVSELGWHVEPLAQLRARHGVFFVTGNHEYYTGLDDWLAEARRLGMRVLTNQHVIVEHGQGRVLIAGVPDFNGESIVKSHHSDPVAAIADASPHEVSVLLAHQPRSVDEAARAGFDLQLSGHTHGGQFLPWNHMVRLQQPFTAGLHSVQRGGHRLWVYVTRGAGYWGPPLRLGVPAEITLIRLVRETDG